MITDLKLFYTKVTSVITINYVSSTTDDTYDGRKTIDKKK